LVAFVESARIVFLTTLILLRIILHLILHLILRLILILIANGIRCERRLATGHGASYARGKCWRHKHHPRIGFLMEVPRRRFQAAFALLCGLPFWLCRCCLVLRPIMRTVSSSVDHVDIVDVVDVVDVVDIVESVVVVIFEIVDTLALVTVSSIIGRLVSDG
jgi:hypothetical protein